jgi:hypothetical protein
MIRHRGRALPALVFTIAATLAGVSRCGRTLPWRSTGRKIGPSVMPDACSHACSAFTGQAIEPRGIAGLGDATIRKGSRLLSGWRLSKIYLCPSAWSPGSAVPAAKLPTFSCGKE